MNFAKWLERVARAEPHRPAIFRGTTLYCDYGGFWDQVTALAGWLRAQGFVPGDRVGIFMKNCPEYLIVQYGIWCAGLAAVPINGKLHPREVTYILTNSGAGMVFATTDEADGLQAVEVTADIVDVGGDTFAAAIQHAPMTTPEPRAADDLCWLFYTSGTTGRPKGVMITHRMLHTMSLTYLADVDEVHPDDCVIYAAPMSHGAGIYNMLHVLRGARHVCPVSVGFDPMEIFALAKVFDRVQMFAAPTMVRRMTDVARATGESGEGLRTVVYAGGRCIWPIFRTRWTPLGRSLSRLTGRANARWGSRR